MPHERRRGSARSLCAAIDVLSLARLPSWPASCMGKLHVIANSTRRVSSNSVSPRTRACSNCGRVAEQSHLHAINATVYRPSTATSRFVAKWPPASKKCPRWGRNRPRTLLDLCSPSQPCDAAGHLPLFVRAIEVAELRGTSDKLQHIYTCGRRVKDVCSGARTSTCSRDVSDMETTCTVNASKIT